MLDLEPIKAREADLVTNVWSVFDDGKVVGVVVCCGGECDKQDCGLTITMSRYDRNLKERRADATFIAHARQDIPALIAEVERLRTIKE
jgi:hypothetical protein